MKGVSGVGLSETMKALGDPVRREILNLLKGGRMTAGDIASRFDMTAATVSYHLAQLKKAGLIFESREKNFIYYTLNASVLEEVLLWLQDLRGRRNHEDKQKRTAADLAGLPAAAACGRGALSAPARNDGDALGL